MDDRTRKHLMTAGWILFAGIVAVALALAIWDTAVVTTQMRLQDNPAGLEAGASPAVIEAGATRFMAWTGALGILIGTGTAALLFFTFRETRRLAEDTRQIGRVQTRARLKVTGVEVPTLGGQRVMERNHEGERVYRSMAYVSLTNEGQSAAVNVSVYITGNVHDFKVSRANDHSMVFQTGDHTVSIHAVMMPIEGPDGQRVSDPSSLPVQLEIGIEYWDVYGESHADVSEWIAPTADSNDELIPRKRPWHHSVKG